MSVKEPLVSAILFGSDTPYGISKEDPCCTDGKTEVQGAARKLLSVAMMGKTWHLSHVQGPLSPEGP